MRLFITITIRSLIILTSNRNNRRFFIAIHQIVIGARSFSEKENMENDEHNVKKSKNEKNYWGDPADYHGS